VCDIHATSYEPAESDYAPAIHAAYINKKYLQWADEVGLEKAL